MTPSRSPDWKTNNLKNSNILKSSKYMFLNTFKQYESWPLIAFILHYTYHFLNPRLKKAHPPFESTFKQCLLRGGQCQSAASYYISIAKIVVKNQLRKYKHISTCQACTQYVQADPELGSKYLTLGN